jgi:hypothetical protein
MLGIQNLGFANALLPVTLANASGSGAAVDTKGYNSVLFVLSAGVTSGSISVFKVQESDTSGGSYTDITGATTTGPGATGDGGLFAIPVNLRDKNRKRFLKVVVTEDNTGSGIYSTLAILGDPDVQPSTATLKGLSGESAIV